MDSSLARPDQARPVWGRQPLPLLLHWGWHNKYSQENFHQQHNREVVNDFPAVNPLTVSPQSTTAHDKRSQTVARTSKRMGGWELWVILLLRSEGVHLKLTASQPALGVVTNTKGRQAGNSHISLRDLSLEHPSILSLPPKNNTSTSNSQNREQMELCQRCQQSLFCCCCCC